MKLIPLGAKTFAKIDDCDFEQLGQMRWTACRNDNSGSYHARLAKDTQAMDRFILGLKKDNPLEVYHINGDYLDCQRSNMRALTRRQLLDECRKRQGKFIGTAWDARRRKWIASIKRKLAGMERAKTLYLGAFDNRWDAYQAYKNFLLDNGLD